MCSSLPYYYALPGCDTVCLDTVWDTWRAYPKATDSFIRLVAVLNLFDMRYFAVHYKKCFINASQISVVVVAMYQ